LERQSGQLGTQLQNEEAEVVGILRDEVERMKTDNLALKRKVDKLSSTVDTMESRIKALESEGE